jgi:nitrogen fixation NifU-like protein
MSNLEDLYREVILDHYHTPRNNGEFTPSAICVEGTNPLCGAETKIVLDVATGVVRDVRFSGSGCSRGSTRQAREMRGAASRRHSLWMLRHGPLVCTSVNPVYSSINWTATPRT